MAKTVIDREFLKGYETLSVGLENCDVYEISVVDILDIYCEVKRIHKKGNEYDADDGFIKISARASQTVECSVLRNDEIGTEWDHRLKERLKAYGGSVVDMTSFSLKDKQGEETDIYVPYDPLIAVLHGSEIELSNCPSLAIDGEGNMTIEFGKRSKQPKRKDNNYAELIVGWKETFGDYSPRTLKVEATFLYNFGNEQTNFSFCFGICDKNFKKGAAQLVFMDCKYIETELFFPKKGYCEIVMSKMVDGRIYVGLDGLGIQFTCASVWEYGYYCGRG